MTRRASIKRRLFWLLACVGLGLALGFAGFRYSGDSTWFAAIPLAVAIGWLVFADPEECLRSGNSGAGDERKGR